MSLRDNLLVEPDESVNGSLSDLQGRKVREKVITNKETHEHPVIYGSLDGGGRRERERERESNYTTISAAHGKSSPPNQKEKADHQCEALFPNTAA